VASPEPFPPYTPPYPAFFRCRCGALVMKVGGKGPAVSPCLGLAHICVAKEKAA
jgi:hypothetical protein